MRLRWQPWLTLVAAILGADLAQSDDDDHHVTMINLMMGQLDISRLIVRPNMCNM